MAKTSTLLPIGLVLSSLVLVGCGSTSNTSSAGNTDLMKRADALKAQEASLAKRQSELASAQQTISQRNAALAAREAELKAAARNAAQAPVQNASLRAGDDQLLPPQAKAGECYARVYTPPKYKVVSERVLKNAETSKVEIIPARYEKGTERLLVRAESKKIQVIPAKLRHRFRARTRKGGLHHLEERHRPNPEDQLDYR